MKLKFEIQKDDLFSFYKFSEWYSPEKEDFRFKQRLNFGFILFFLPFTLFIFSDQNFNLLFFIGLPFFGFGFFIAKPLMTLKLKSTFEKFLKNSKNQGLTGEKTLEFSADHIQWFDLNSEGKFSINEIDKFLDDRYNYYIYLCNLSALIIPKRIFTTEYKVQEFEDWLNDTRSKSSSIKPFRYFE
ncbi:YcxB family protein [Algoriphagus aquimarinus]|uniref:YcxB family protein n=2 Tax=Algoriphagus aquimarinus TaxID=237018 RepID=A0A5C7AWX3_9BACT|nr:YcxB family protein [Algoriphagus aquimarinus]